MVQAEPLLLTVKEACAKLGVSKTYFYKLRAMGLVNTVPLPGRTQSVRVHIDDVEECARLIRRGDVT